MTDTPTNPGVDAKRVLIIKLSALGDFVMSLGAARRVREVHPNADITLLTTPFLKVFAEACPYFDHVESDGRPKGLGPQNALLKRISNARYDIVYDFQTSNRTNTYWKLLKRLPHLKVPPWSGAAQGQPFFHANPERSKMHPVDRLADQLEYAAIDTSDPLPDLSWVRTARGDGPELQPERFDLPEKYALLIPGASAHRGAKRWPENRYAGLAARLADDGITPAIIGGPAEKDIAAAIKLREPRIKNLTGLTSLFQIVTLAERAAIVIGNDTGPMHMATLAGAKGVALFATDESDPVQARPRGSPVKTASAPRADQIGVDDVWNSVSILLKNGSVPKKALLEKLQEARVHSVLGLMDGSSYQGYLQEIGETTFTYASGGPLAPEEPLILNIEDLDPFAIEYFDDDARVWIGLLG